MALPGPSPTSTPPPLPPPALLPLLSPLPPEALGDDDDGKRSRRHLPPANIFIFPRGARVFFPFADFFAVAVVADADDNNEKAVPEEDDEEEAEAEARFLAVWTPGASSSPLSAQEAIAERLDFRDWTP